MDQVTRVRQAVLYEGYLLWPYRRSSLKNTQPWTLGGVYPEGYRDAGDSSETRTQVLVEAGPADTVDVQVCFLHLVGKGVRRSADGELRPVAELVTASGRHRPGEEATERTAGAAGLHLGELAERPVTVDVDVPEGRDVEWLGGTDGGDGGDGPPAGALVRHWHALRGRVEIGASLLRPGVYRLSVRTVNTSEWEGGTRAEAMRRAFVSAHTVLRSPGGRFVSQTDPPEEFRTLAEDCVNEGAWPVLAGEDGDRHTVLSAPIILYDHPRIAPESPGDFYDATEIDQLLTLSVLSLTDEERREVCEGDPRGRAIVERCAALSPEELMRLHGVMRDVRPLTGKEPGA